jgi:hypothetical protein
MTTDKEFHSALIAAQAKLNDKDAEFAANLARGFGRYGSFTGKQLYWVKELIKRAQPQAAPVKIAADLKPILATFAHAAKHLKRPGFRIATDDAVAIRLKVAGSASRYCGQVQVLGDGHYEDRAYFGRIDLEGVFHPGRDAAGQEPQIARALANFAQDPAKASKEYARLFGRCCFCNLELTDARSTAVGYGPICADHYGLPWGDVELEIAA